MKHKLLVSLCSLMLFGCSSNAIKTETDLLKESNDTLPAINISREILDDMMQTLPSPIETANLITLSKTGFNKAILIPANNAENFSDKHSQAIAMGGYGVDLGYLNLNNKMLYVVDYLESLNTVSKELKVNHFLDFATLSNLAKNRNNVDSLIQISTQNFNQIDEYLRSQNRGDLSVLILIGSWIEGLHMFNYIAKESPSTEINNRIGEQKIIIDNIYAILAKIDKIEYYRLLKVKLNGLKKAYDHVKITYVYKEPEMKEVNGELVVTDKSETIIALTEDDLKAISAEITLLRNDLFMIGKQ